MHHHSTCRHLLSTLFLGSLALAHTYVGAQTTAANASQARTVDPVVSTTAFAPPVVYRSVFVDTPSGIVTEETDWKKANAEVGYFKRGHMDILRWEIAQEKARANATKNVAPRAENTGAKP